MRVGGDNFFWGGCFEGGWVVGVRWGRYWVAVLAVRCGKWCECEC